MATIEETVNPSNAVKRFPTMAQIERAMVADGWRIEQAEVYQLVDRQFAKETPYGVLYVYFLPEYRDILYWPRLKNRSVRVLHVQWTPTIKMVMANVKAFEETLITDAKNLIDNDKNIN